MFGFIQANMEDLSSAEKSGTRRSIAVYAVLLESATALLQGWGLLMT